MNEISKFYPIINASYQTREAQGKRQLMTYFLLISLLTLFLILSLAYVYRQIRKISAIREELVNTNACLVKLNGEISETNNLLQERNIQLSESNHIKEEYIAHFLDLCSTYINKLEDYQKSLQKKAMNKQLDELFKMLRSTRMVENEVEALYVNFDRIFLGLYPTFVRDFNALLQPEERIVLKSEDLLKRDFHSDAPLEKCITDITEIPARNGKLYVSAIFDCFDLSVLGLAMETNMKADLCIHTLENALTAYPALEGAVIHSDRGTQYTSDSYRQAIREHHIHQSMNSAGGRCHDNARCESMWARMKTELLYDRYDTKQMKVEELKVLIWRYFLSYWNNRRICTANGGLPPMVKRRQYYEALDVAA